MNIVNPIRDLKKIDSMKIYLKGKNIRDYTMFVVGINVALRVSDLLELKWEDILDGSGKKFKKLELKEGKTGKAREIKLNKASQKALRELLDASPNQLHGYIFKSRVGENKPITRQQALSVLKDAAKAVGVEDNVGTHTLRKTWGYHAWKNGYNPAVIMETLNHSNLAVTKKYLGIRQDDINDVYDGLNL